MIAPYRLLLLGIAFASCLRAEAARAGTVIEFPNTSGQATPAHLLGYLARPDLGLFAVLGGGANAAAPYPAVVVLHGCSGFSSHNTKIADQLASWGYLALAVDSLGSRGIDSRCGGPNLPDQASDAYAALRYLSQLDFVDPTRVAVLGESMGGFSVLHVIDRNLATRHSGHRFRAAIAYYPLCDIPSPTMSAPTLILIGEADETTPAENCQAMVEHSRPEGAPISLTVYSGAYHAFNVTRFDPVFAYSATGMNTTSRRRETPKRRCVPFSPGFWQALPQERPTERTRITSRAPSDPDDASGQSTSIS